ILSFTAPAPTKISTLSLHDALPISTRRSDGLCSRARLNHEELRKRREIRNTSSGKGGGPPAGERVQPEPAQQCRPDASHLRGAVLAHRALTSMHRMAWATPSKTRGSLKSLRFVTPSVLQSECAELCAWIWASINLPWQPKPTAACNG